MKLPEEKFLDLVYPIGSIYMSTNSTNPASLFGGSWSQIQGRFLLGQSSSYAANSTGGSSTRMLTESNLPQIYPISRSSNKNVRLTSNGYSLSNLGSGSVYLAVDGDSNNSTDDVFKITGSSSSNGTSFSVMPPYFVVYMWQRIS